MKIENRKKLGDVIKEYKEKNTDNKPCCNNSGHSNGYRGVYTSYKSASQQGRHCSLGA